MPSVNNATVKSLLQPVYDAQMRQIAGTYWPMLLKIFLVVLIVKRLDEIIQSAIQDSKIDKNHMAKYGSEDKIPFYIGKKRWLIHLYQNVTKKNLLSIYTNYKLTFHSIFDNFIEQKGKTTNQ